MEMYIFFSKNDRKKNSQKVHFNCRFCFVETWWKLAMSQSLHLENTGVKKNYTPVLLPSNMNTIEELLTAIVLF